MAEIMKDSLSAEESRQLWINNAIQQLQEGYRIIRAEEEKLQPLRRQLNKFKLANFCSWVIGKYPQVHFLTMEIGYGEIILSGIYGADEEDVDDPDEKILDDIQEHLQQNYYTRDFDFIMWTEANLSMLDLYAISKWQP